MRILFVCLGNICRSPIAEGVMKHKAAAAGLDWTIESAGTESSHLGEPPHRFSQAVCHEHGIEIKEQRARLFAPGDLAAYDHVYAMAEDVLHDIKSIGRRTSDYSRVQLFLEDLHPGEKASVPDPWYGDESGYPAVYDLIDKGCDAILKNLTSGTH